MIRSVFITVGLITAFQVALSQHQNIQLPLSGSSYQPEEPCIYVNPKNTDQLMAGANINSVYVSNDGGSTWEKGELAPYKKKVRGWANEVQMVELSDA